MMKFLKRQNAAFYLVVVAFILTIVGITMTCVSSGVAGYSIAGLGGILACTIIAAVLLAGSVVLANIFGSHNFLTLAAQLVALVLLMVAFGKICSARAILAGAQFTYDSVNETGWTVLYESIVAIVMYLVSAILITVGVFFKDKPKADASSSDADPSLEAQA